jgi:nucleoside-diphosphate-sugar epimerase
MNIAILGATSQIAKDLVLSFSAQGQHTVALYARRPEAVKQWLASVGLTGRHSADDFQVFGKGERFDAIINFVGVGNPAQAVAMGASIFDITLKYDQMALDYLQAHPDCRYIFFSSGAAYGSDFEAPVDASTKAVVSINHLQPQDWYAAAKLHAECRHRSLAPLSIVDIRVFNYFSHTQDMAGRFLITDILRAIRDKTVLKTSPGNIVRDYLHPEDFFALVSAILSAPAGNTPLDCYSKAPIDKLQLLAAMQNKFGLQYQVMDAEAGINATGTKPHYYSKNKRAADFGYEPALTSLEGVIQEASLMLQKHGLQAGRN